MASNQKNAAEIDRLAVQLAKNPQSKVFLPLAEEYCKVGMWEEAVSVLEEGLKHYPGFITAMVALGRTYDQLDQPTKARAVLEGAVKLSPDNLRAHRTLIKIYQAQGLTEEVLQSCRVILAMNPRDEEALSVQASLSVPDELDPQDNSLSVDAGTLVSTSGVSSAQMPQVSNPDPKVQDEAPPQVLEQPSTRKWSDAEVRSQETTGETSLNLMESYTEPTLEEQNQVHRESHAEISLESPPPASEITAVSPRHAKMIAKLESWLRSIERHRRDRVIPSDRAA